MSYDPYGQPTQQPAPYQQGPYAASPYAPGMQPKSKTTAALLAFFLGGFGVHNFYRGQTSRGIGHIVLAALGIIIVLVGAFSAASQITPGGSIPDGAAAGGFAGFAIGYLMLIGNSIWAFVEFILILVSKDGSLR
ncbi:TM2 domain [Actinomyces bovis]|uniref:TM2 domain n=1 Tax=Actinomyces bovis TaxID=1658 RepID=A0ABY1VP22_9ACTO|nr:TM2 domain-containing protein [Actinomyces bovis]SPT53543.1 TM2 domain [Actinomyces bovis]VEG55507.1 TM2 domain [Actinomyces israelii]